MQEEYIELRRALHMHPELSFSEKWTSERICKQLDKLGISYQTGIADTYGILAQMTGQPGEKTLLLRADMDALPVQEENTCSYRSQIDGVMHACGHDVHVATLLKAASVLQEKKALLKGTVKFAFQPGEETTGGAKPMIDAGILKNPDVDYCCGFHVNPDVETGKVIVSDGPIMASPDNFYITLNGRGGHCATPEKNDDLIAIAGILAQKLQALSVRNQDFTQSVIVTVCTLQAGMSPNAMTDTVVLSGSFRTFNASLREKTASRIQTITKLLAADFKVRETTEIELLYPPLINDTFLTSRMKDCAIRSIGAENVITAYTPSMIGEDFAYFGQYVPATYFYLGAQKNGHPTTLHASNFDVDENCIAVGAKVLSDFALDLLK